MNKIQYILDLTNIILPKDVRAETEKRIRCAEEKTEKKKSRRLALIAVISAVVFVALIVSVSAVINNANNKPAADGTTAVEIDTTYETATAPETETTADTAAPYGDDGYYIFTPLYENDFHYDVFKDTIRFMTPYNDSIVVNDDLSALYGYFGEAEPTADELCRTLFAFYEPGCVKFTKSISLYSDDALQEIKEQMKIKEDEMNGYYHNGVSSDEIILLAAKNGTFEYLLTLPVNRDITKTSSLRDKNGFETGTYGIYGGVEGYRIAKNYLASATANVYKIRFETGLPVIYGKYTLPAGDLTASETKEGLPIRSVGINASVNYIGIETVESARFKINNAIIEFTGEENFMYDPVYTKNADGGFSNSSDLEIVSLCDYPYSLPPYDKNSGLCGRRTVCEIINRYNLQWFFPMYVTGNQTGDTMIIIGEGVKTGEAVYDSGSVLSSVMYEVYGTAYEDNIYKTYRGTPLNVCYLPETGDTPYFDRSFFSTNRSYMVVTIKIGSAMSVGIVYSNELGGSLSAFVSPVNIEPEFTSELLYIKDRADTVYPSRPFDIKYLPLLREDISETPRLFTGLGLDLPEYGHINSYLSDLMLGHREISVIGTEEVIILSAGDLASSSVIIKAPDGVKQYTVTAYEEISGYIIDMSGCVCGLRASGSVYPFSTVEPDFTLTVRSEDGSVTYAGAGNGSETDNTLYGTSVVFDNGSKISLSGIRADTLIYMLCRYEEKAPVLEMFEDPENDKYTFIAGIDVINMPAGYVYGIKNGDSRVYTYYSNLKKTYKNNTVYWECPSDTHIHGFCRYTLIYDGNEIEIRRKAEILYAE